MAEDFPTPEGIRAAAGRIAPHIHRTPVLTSSWIDSVCGASVFFKCENFQRVGAFKIRGACNAVLSLTEQEAAAGVVTHSSGNHAQALALAARIRGVTARIVMPRTAPGIKRAATEGYGARITLCEPTLEARESAAARIIEETGATLIHPYNNTRVIEGQGTCALELLEDAPAPDVVLAPVGGGGLLAGTALAVHGVRPEVRVWGAEPAGADDAARSLREGRIVPSVRPQTVADGLLTSLGERNFAIIRKHVERIVTVTDREIIDAMRVVWERMKIVIEPSSAVPVAALLRRPPELAGLRVGVILSGGNVDLSDFFAAIRPRDES